MDAGRSAEDEASGAVDGSDSISPPPDLGPMPIVSNPVPALDLRMYVHCLIILTLLLIDFVPRFYQGDSLEYVQSNWDGWLPPQRSWSFGLVVNFLLRWTHGYSSFIIIQAVILGSIVVAARRFFQGLGSWQLTYSVTAVVLCLDPLLEVYTRFYLTDFLASACFIVCLLCLMVAIDPASSRGVIGRGLLTYLFGGIVTIFLRIAFLPILEFTVLFFAICWRRRLSARGWITLAAAAGIPVLAIGLLAAANSIVFAKWFPNEVFVNKMSGIMLAATFAPALQIADFERAKVPITPEEFSNLDLGNYDKRGAQIWWKSSKYLNSFLKEKFNARNNEVDEAAKRLVTSALLRDPLSLAEVYLRTGWGYLQPLRWKWGVNGEMGLRPLPQEFVDYFNTFSVTKLVPAVSEVRSPLVLLAQTSAPFYPFLLGLGVLSAVILLLREGTRPGVTFLCCGLFADLLAAPLYSVSTIPRYLLAGVFISYLLLGLVGLSLFSSRVRSKEA